MNPVFTLVRDNMSDTLPRYAEVMGRTGAEVVKRAAKGVTRRVQALTPPAHSVAGSEQAAISGAAAHRHGRKKIKKSLSSVLAPVRLKGRRLVTHVYGRKLKTPVYVATRERHPDVARTYREQRGIRGPKEWVDVRKFNAVLKAKEKNVGKLASGFSAAAAALDVPVQQWIGRHGRGRGTVKMNLLSAQMRITVTNMVPAGLDPKTRAETDRRIGYAIRYQRGAMKREMDFYAYKKAHELAIKTRNFTGLIPEGMQGG